MCYVYIVLSAGSPHVVSLPLFSSFRFVDASIGGAIFSSVADQSNDPYLKFLPGQKRPVCSSCDSVFCFET